MLHAAILAGGLATRLRPLTSTIPKALIPINGEPFLAHQLRLLKRAGFKKVVLCLGHLGEQICDFVRRGKSFGLEVEYSFDGPQLLGTGGAIRRALPMLGEAFFVLYGDSYLPCDYSNVQRCFFESGNRGLMTVFRNEGRWDKSNVEFSGGRITNYDKVHPTSQMHHIDYGLGVFRSDVFISFAGDTVLDLTTVYKDLLQDGQLAAYEVQQRFYEIGSRAGIEDLEAYLVNARQPAVFLDRDGVLNEALIRDRHPFPPSNLAELKILEGAANELRRLKDAGFLLIVVTNQPDVARGIRARRSVEEINEAVMAALPLDDVYVCFHSERDACDCRKPKPGLLLQASADRSICLERSFLIGDRWRDIDAGAAAGCRTVLIDYDYDEPSPSHAPAHRAASLHDAVEWILQSLTQS